MPLNRRSKRLKQNVGACQKNIEDYPSYAVHHQSVHCEATIEEYCRLYGISKDQYKLNIVANPGTPKGQNVSLSEKTKNEPKSPRINQRLFIEQPNKDMDLKMTEYLIWSQYLTMFALFFGVATLLLHYLVFPIIAPSLSLLLQSTVFATKIRMGLNATNFLISSGCSFWLTETIQSIDGNAIFQETYNNRIRAQRIKPSAVATNPKNPSFVPQFNVHQHKLSTTVPQPASDESLKKVVKKKIVR